VLVTALGDGPVAVFDPVGDSEAVSVVIAAGDDHIPRSHLGRRRGVIKTMRSCATVEFGDKRAGGGDHDRVEPSRSVGKPSVERILGGFG
jgi:hypothetical protein